MAVPPHGTQAIQEKLIRSPPHLSTPIEEKSTSKSKSIMVQTKSLALQNKITQKSTFLEIEITRLEI